MPDRKTSEVIVDEIDNGVAVVTLNRPESLNAISVSMMRKIRDHLLRLDGDESVRSIVLAGAGDRAFSAGFDIVEMAEFSPEIATATNNEREEWLWKIASLDTPLIAAVGGMAYGAGALLATASDMRVGQTGTIFKFTAGALGYANFTWCLPLIVGLANATDYLLTAREIRGREAHEAGLLNRLVPEEDVVRTSIELASSIAAHPPQGMRDVKRLLRSHIGESLEARYRKEAALQRIRLGAASPAELFETFLQRRTGETSA